MLELELLAQILHPLGSDRNQIPYQAPESWEAAEMPQLW